MKDISEILLLHHNHNDIGYTHPQPVYWELSDRFMDEAMALCEKTAHLPDGQKVRWTCEVTAPLLHWLRTADKSQIRRLKVLVSNQQFSIGAMYCNVSALFNTSELIQSFYPIKLIREVLGAPVKVAINHDVNGLPWSIIGILLDSGIEGLIMGINVHMGGYPLHRPLAFNWQGPDGRKIPVFSGEHYNHFNRVFKTSETTDVREMAAGYENYLAKLKRKDYPYDFIFLSATHPAFNDNNPPDVFLPDRIKSINESGLVPPIRMVTPEMLLAKIRSMSSNGLPTHRGDWVDYWTFGCASSALEVVVNRKARNTLSSAEALQSQFSEVSEKHRKYHHEAFNQMAIFDEHTWGAFCSTGAFCPTHTVEPIPVAEQWYLKAAHAYGANSMSNLLYRDLLELHAKNPSQGHGINGLMIFNPAPVRRTDFVRIPKDLAEGKWPHISSTVQQIPILQSFLDDSQAFFYGPIEMVPYEIRQIPIAEVLQKEISSEIKITESAMETRYYRLTFNPETGHINSLVDIDQDDELIDSGSEWQFFEPVIESMQEMTDRAIEQRDPRESFCELDFEKWHDGSPCWNNAWKAKYERPHRLCSLETYKTPEGAVLKRKWAGPGREAITQSVTIYNHKKSIGLESFFNKADNHFPEGLYFSFPLAVKNGRIHYDSGNAATEYGVEQLEGGCLDWVTVNTYIAVQSDGLCIQISAPDAPLFQLGDFNFARSLKTKHAEASSLILAWPMNNYWNTNFRISQPGPIRLRYELTSFAHFNAARCSNFAQQAMMGLDFHPILQAGIRIDKKIIAWSNEHVTVVSLKKSGDNRNDIVLWLYNHSNKAENVEVVLNGLTPRLAYRCDTLEEIIEPVVVRADVIYLMMAGRALQGIRIKL
jgi:hypothetical protein